MKAGRCLAPAAPPGPASDRRRGDTFRLIAAAQGGDARAVERLLVAHRGLITASARRLASGRGGKTLDELEADGLTALWEAVMRFDPARGCEFSTYAVWRIRSKMRPAASQARQWVRERAGASETEGGPPLESLAVAPDASEPSLADVDAMALLMPMLAPMEQNAFRAYLGLPPDDDDVAIRPARAREIVSLAYPRLKAWAASADGLSALDALLTVASAPRHNEAGGP